MWDIAGLIKGASEGAGKINNLLEITIMKASGTSS
jgi:ribosome-binding ATPase YchF (GTP1/OBG family)